MPWTRVRKDFTDRVACKFCDHAITSGVGTVVRNEKGDEAFSGPTCAKRRTDNPNEPIPDITSALLMPEVEAKGKPNRGGTRHGSGAPSQEEDVHQLVSYLLLRCDKLTHYQSMRNAKLLDVYERYSARDFLSESDRPYVRNLIGFMSKTRPAFSLRNLRQVYACEFWILKFIEIQEEEDGREFGRSLLRYLRERLCLTSKQVNGLNKWLTNMQGMGLIDPDGFSR